MKGARELIGRLRESLPRPARKLIGAILQYGRRVGRWAVILGQVRGASWRDELILLASATAAPFSAIRRLSRWQDPILLFDAVVEVGGVGTFHLRRHSDDLWHVLPWRERGIHAALRHCLGPGDLFVDAGANIGVYTVLASRLVGPAGRVLAIEMMPDTAAILRLHLETNGCSNVEIVENALSDRSGKTLTARVPAGKYGQASITVAPADAAGLEERRVRTITLDEACGQYGRIRLLKLDLEGAELQALAGGRSVLDRTDKVVYEAHTAEGELAELFEQAGFRISHRLGKDRLVERAGVASTGS